MIQEKWWFCLGFVIDFRRTSCFRSQDIVAEVKTMTERKLITTPQIDEQLNVSTPQRAVIVYCSLIEGAQRPGRQTQKNQWKKRLCPALTQQTAQNTQTHTHTNNFLKKTAEAKLSLWGCMCVCMRANKHTHYIYTSILWSSFQMYVLLFLSRNSTYCDWMRHTPACSAW